MENLLLNMLLIGVVTVAFSGSIGCGKKTDSTDDAENGAEVAVSSGVGALSGAMGAANTSAPTANLFRMEAPATRLASFFKDSWFVPPAFATVTSCSSGAIADTCSSSTKSATYTDCPIGLTGLTYSGTVTLTFSRSNCLMLISGDYFTRTVNLTRTGLAGSKILSSSDSHTDYRGNMIGGGTKISVTSGGYEMSIPGMHKVKTNSAGTSVFDVSIRTTQAFSVTNPSTTPVTVSSGSLEVIHNKAQYVATFSASSLVYDYSGSCCYPISGTLSVSYSGAITGSASVSFGGTCGEVTFTKDSVSKTVTLTGCQ